MIPRRSLAGVLVAMIAGSLVAGCGSDPIKNTSKLAVPQHDAPRATYKIVELPPGYETFHPGNKGGGGGGGGGVTPLPPSASPSGRRVLFLNKNGGIYRRGWDDSGSNVSSILETASVKIPPYAESGSSWSSLKTCVAQQFARWNVTVTDVDPGNTPHIEAVIGGRPALLGLPHNVAGVAPMTKSGATIEEAVVYVFSDVITGSDKECEVTAHEIGHAIGLEHVYLCADPMTYLTGCGKKSFQDEAAWCGEDHPHACRNGGKQNSVQFLNARLGAVKPNDDLPKQPPIAPPLDDDDDDDEVAPPPKQPPKQPPKDDEDDDGEVVPPVKPPPPPVTPPNDDQDDDDDGDQARGG